MPLEAERLGDDADGQCAEVTGDLRDDRRSARPCATAHAGRDEDHVRVLERLVDLLGVVLRRALADDGIPAGTQAAGDLVADAILCGASDCRRACASVFTAMNSTPMSSARIIRFTALLPPPPTPMTRMSAKFSESDRSGIALSSIMSSDASWGPARQGRWAVPRSRSGRGREYSPQRSRTAPPAPLQGALRAAFGC